MFGRKKRKVVEEIVVFLVEVERKPAKPTHKPVEYLVDRKNRRCDNETTIVIIG